MCIYCSNTPGMKDNDIHFLNGILSLSLIVNGRHFFETWKILSFDVILRSDLSFYNPGYIYCDCVIEVGDAD